MKLTKIFLAILILFAIFTLSYSADLREYLKAEDYLKNSGEVYFRFTVDSKDQINNMLDYLFLEHIDGLDVYTYANRKGFERFLEKGLSFEILTPAGMEGPKPKMSDYSRVDMENLTIDRYPTYHGFLELMNKFQSTYPDKCKLDTIGQSVRNRLLVFAKISDNVNERENEPKFFHSSTIHGNETAGFMLTLRLMDLLLRQYRKDEQITRIVDNMEIWFAPLMNPDGTYNGGNNTVFNSKRTNANNQDLNRDYPWVPTNDGTVMPRVKAQKETVACMAFEKKHNFVLSIDNHGYFEACYYPWAIKGTPTVDQDWFKYVSNQYAAKVHSLAPNNHFTYANNGVGNWNRDMYYSAGTRPDWQYRYRHCRQVTIELSRTKILPENDFDDWWEYHRQATLDFYEEIFNGINGTVVDSITGKGLSAKVYIENVDDDSSHVYADMPHGNFYRPIIKGTYSVTFSCKDYYDKTIKNVKVENGKGTKLEVKLLNKNVSINTRLNMVCNTIRCIPFGKGIAIKTSYLKNGLKMRIIDLNGKIIYRQDINNCKNKIIWNGKNSSNIAVGAGCYIIEILTKSESLKKAFVLSR